MKKYLLVLSITPFLLCGCTRTVEHIGKKVDPDVLKEIHEGLLSEDVESILGTPSFKTTFGERVWYYGTRAMGQVAFFNPKMMGQSIVAITFDKNDRVKNIARLDERAARDIDISLKETPAPGHHGGVFESLFGHTKHYAAEKK